MARQRKNIKEQLKLKQSPFKDYWNNNNMLILSIGIGLLIIGFYLMSISPWSNPISLSLSPIVLLIAYLIIIPLSILLKKFPSKKDKENVPSKG